ncbi:Cupredoxin [Xylariales sp. AK1849]|nr:Cupredoxin [Xylariales sp. AK1849]
MLSISNLGRLAVVLSLLPTSLAKDWEGEPYTWLYQFPLPIPPVKAPKLTITNPVTNKPIDYYEINIKPLTQQVYPGKSPAKLVGYDGISPGPTFMIERGRETVVRFINNSTSPNSVHLHGSPSRAPWDGWAEDVTLPNQYKDYYYPNSQSARNLWYHDHAVDITAVNAYFGQAGVYLIHDPAEDSLGLPSGYGVYDIPLVLSAKQYQKDGTLYSPAGETTSLYGDVIHVNGQPWPYLKVEPRKYRFRFLDAAISRSFNLYFEPSSAAGIKIPFQVVASDAGLMSAPAATDKLAISMAERYEVVIDFSKFKGQNVTLRSDRIVGADTPYLNTDKVMRFVVSSAAVSDPSTVPGTLRNIPSLPAKSTVAHHFNFERTNGEWRINGVSFADVNNRVLAKPPRGTIEVWELQNTGGGWTHPVHIHLVDFKVVSRTGGSRGVQNYEAQGLKDVVWLQQGETVQVEAQYAPWDGLYMFHCHNLIHEDHEMMAAFNVTALSDLGYTETSFVDPMETRWRAKDAVAEDFTTAAITAKVQSMAALQPYNNVDATMQKLNEYWATHGGARVKARRVS